MSTIDTSTILKRDPGLVGASLDRLADQLRDGWIQAQRVKLPKSYRHVSNIALCGMGGSHLGGDILRAALGERLKVPVAIVADYHLPAWVTSSTLVIASSYSGSTEETVSAVKQAQRRRAKIMVVTTGGSLATWARHQGLPLYQYHPTENPSGQPRLGAAYGMMAMVSAWRKLGLVKIDPTEIKRLPVIAWEATKRYRAQLPLVKNPAKQLALAWKKSVPLLIGAEWTAGNLHTFANQIHENGKTFADWKLLPDLNHHLLEGLRNRRITKQVSALMVLDDSYHPRTQRRFTLTAKILKQLGAKISTYQPRGATDLEKSIDLLAFGGYVSWYLAAARNVKPAPIPTVDYLKQKLGK